MKFIVISGVCCNGTCKRTPVIAKYWNHGWLTLCEQCKDIGSIKLDEASLNKIIAAQKKNKELQR